MQEKQHIKDSILGVIPKVLLILGALVIVYAFVILIVPFFVDLQNSTEVADSMEVQHDIHHMEVSDNPAPELETVNGAVIKVPYPPHYLQINEKWKDLPYSKETIETYGCGLTCAASYICWVTQDPSYNVETLYQSVGDSCLTDGVNDMGKFCEYISKNYNVTVSGQEWKNDVAKNALRDGDMMFASMSGELIPGHKNYGGHIVLIYKWDDKGIWVMDPDDPDSEIPISEQRFDEIFGYDQYFYLLHVNRPSL